MELVTGIAELYRRAATALPADVEKAIRKASKQEEGPARAALGMIIENIEIARKESRSICQDTGTPIFYVRRPAGMGEREIRDAIIAATRKATAEVPLRPNAVDSLTGKNSKDNVGFGIPVMHFEEVDANALLHIQLLLKGGGSENVGATYTLPNELGGRDLAGVKACVMDAVKKARGKGCPPGIIGVCFGSPKELTASLALRQLLRKLDDKNPAPELSAAETELCTKLNSLGIGPAGFGGKTTVLGVKMCAAARNPPSFFVDISYCCWALRRASATFSGKGVSFD